MNDVSDARARREPLRLIVAGATGLVGAEAVRLAASDQRFGTVVALSRRRRSWAWPKVTEEVVDYDHLGDWQPVGGVDVAFCSLGTTIRAAGSREAFRRVDFEYVMAFAQRVRASGATAFLLVSAAGANASSRIFYSRAKGEVESAVQQLGFARVVIARPSFLLGERAEFRLGEVILKPVSRLFPAKYRGVHATQVAGALLAVADRMPAGNTVLENEQLVRWHPDSPHT